MKKLLAIPAYLWAIICMLLIPVTFMGNSGFARNLAKLPYMKIHPVFSGGDVDRAYNSTDSILITVYKPVFPALIGESRKGFVQVRFSGKVSLPELIDSEIDYNNDGSPDFSLSIHTSDGKTGFKAFNNKVTGLNVSVKVKEDWLIRVNLCHNLNANPRE